MIDENLEIVEVALTVVAPRTRKDLVEVGMIALLFRHLDGRGRTGLGLVTWREKSLLRPRGLERRKEGDNNELSWAMMRCT
jgi:hypothetical protein